MTLDPMPEPRVTQKEGPAGLSSLGNKVTEFNGTLEGFPVGEHPARVLLDCQEVTGLCPVTGQPDYYNITIEYIPRNHCVESKSLKLYLQSFRNKGIFCEAISGEIAEKFNTDLKPWWIRVVVKQASRGGISISATSVVVAEGGENFV